MSRFGQPALLTGQELDDGNRPLANRRADRHEDRGEPPLRIGRDAEDVARTSARPRPYAKAVRPSGVPTPRSYIMPRANPANAPRSDPAPAPAPAASASTTWMATPSTGYVAQTVRWIRQYHQGNGDQSSEEGKRQ